MRPKLRLDSTMNRAVPLTPTHSAGLVSIWEAEDTGRVGLEVYYVGEHTLMMRSVVGFGT